MRPGLTLTRCQLVTTTTTTRVSRVAAGPLCLHAVTLTPAGLMEPIRSYYSISFRLPQLHGGSAPALIVSRPAQRSLTLRPACSPSRLSDPLHRRLRRLRFLHRRSDCYRVERTSSRAGLSPALNQRLSRRTRNRDFGESGCFRDGRHQSQRNPQDVSPLDQRSNRPFGPRTVIGKDRARTGQGRQSDCRVFTSSDPAGAGASPSRGGRER